MFTIKIYSMDKDGNEIIQHSISAPHYSIREINQENKVLCIYKDFTITNGVEYRFSTEDRDFTCCYVENSAGKTIDKVVLGESSM